VTEGLGGEAEEGIEATIYVRRAKLLVRVPTVGRPSVAQATSHAVAEAIQERLTN
jgi:hypothetical protein